MKVNEDMEKTLLRSRLRTMTDALAATTSALERSASLTMAEKAEAVSVARAVLHNGGR